ncbi:hypothetical protein D3C86_1112440 [compost metagenome]
MEERFALSQLALNTNGMPSLLVTSTYFSHTAIAMSRDSSTFMPPNSTKGLSLATSIALILIFFCSISASLSEEASPDPLNGGAWG